MKAMESKKITKGVFDAGKILIQNGATNAEIAKYLKVSVTVVTMFRQAETYEEYQNIMYEYSKGKVKEKEPETMRQSVTIQATHYMQKELEKTNELLTLISNKLAFIVDELCGVKKTGAGE